MYFFHGEVPFTENTGILNVSVEHILATKRFDIPLMIDT